MSFDADQMGKLRRFFHELSLDPRGGAPNAALALDGTQRALALGLARVKGAGSEPLLDGPFGRLVEGWNAYFSGAYEQARAAFEAGEDVSADWQSWRSLGLGKVASDLGHWRLAASWLQRAMGQAEQQNDTVRMAEAAGALGEVLVRAGHPLSALDLFTFDRALLPPGEQPEDLARLQHQQARGGPMLGQHQQQQLAMLQHVECEAVALGGGHREVFGGLHRFGHLAHAHKTRLRNLDPHAVTG